MPDAVLIQGAILARKILKRYMPDAHTVREHKHLQFFGTLLHDANLWHMNRESVSRAFAIGLFWAFIPIPFQMIPSAALAIYFRANLVISVALVWISNPLTMPPLYYFCYLVGTWIIGAPQQNVVFEMTWEWLTHELLTIWQPFLLGCLIVGGVLSVLGYFGMHGFWRWHVVRNWERRKKRRQS